MHRRIPLFARITGVAAAAVLAIAGTGGIAAAAPQADEPASTPVDYHIVAGATYAYVVNARQLTPGQQMLVENAVRDSGGTIVMSYPQIGVVVAHSANANFKADVMKNAKGNSVLSVGMTRTVPVKEGTIDNGKTTPGATGKGQQADGVVSEDTSEDVVPDPNEALNAWSQAQIQATAAHEITDGSPRVLVGILDSGIDPNHNEFQGKINYAASVGCVNAGVPNTSPDAWKWTNSTHGTHVAGIIAAARNGIGIVGVAPAVSLAIIKVVNDDGFIYPEYAICGFVWAAEHGVSVTNNSYYIDPFEYWCSDQPDQAAAKEAITRAVNYATSKGIVSVVAAGNGYRDLNFDAQGTTVASAPKYKYYDVGSPNDAAAPTVRQLNSNCTDLPNEIPTVVSVSATTSTGALASFSNRGLGKIDVAAPGNGIQSTLPGNAANPTGRYGSMSGTSMASPHVAGVMALMKSAHPNWTPAQMIDYLHATALPHACPASPTRAQDAPCMGTTEYNSYYGYGIANALGAVQ